MKSVLGVLFIFILILGLGHPSTAQAASNIFENPNAVDLSWALKRSTALDALNFLDGYEKWSLFNSSCNNCPIKIVTVNNSIAASSQARLFLNTLAEAKSELMALYPGLHGQEYNLLAHMAAGILGRETDFFRSPRYKIKEAVPGLVTAAKVVVSFVHGRQLNNNSRGPTQIKIVPEKIAEHYGIEEDELKDPSYAALATMGYLIEALSDLRRYVSQRKIKYISADKIVDYLPYIYFGGRKALLNKTATPDKNAYVNSMKKYMAWVQIYEMPLDHCAAGGFQK